MPLFIFRSAASITRLEERLLCLEKSFKSLELEWIDTYDKVRRAMFRIVKSRAIIEAAEEKSGTPEGEPGAAISPVPGSPHGYLTPRQKELQQAILKRRAGLQ